MNTLSFLFTEFKRERGWEFLSFVRYIYNRNFFLFFSFLGGPKRTTDSLFSPVDYSRRSPPLRIVPRPSELRWTFMSCSLKKEVCRRRFPSETISEIYLRCNSFMDAIKTDKLGSLDPRGTRTEVRGHLQT